jgi:hypothetical protein
MTSYSRPRWQSGLPASGIAFEYQISVCLGEWTTIRFDLPSEDATPYRYPIAAEAKPYCQLGGWCLGTSGPVAVLIRSRQLVPEPCQKNFQRTENRLPVVATKRGVLPVHVCRTVGDDAVPDGAHVGSACTRHLRQDDGSLARYGKAPRCAVPRRRAGHRTGTNGTLAEVVFSSEETEVAV